MSAAAVSQQVRALEGHLGRDLFIRHARRVRLSDAGRAFVPVVRESLASLETTAAALFGDRAKAVLNVQATLVFACGWLAPRLPDFEAAHPGIQLNLATANQPEEFARAGADLQVVFGSSDDMPADADKVLGERLYPVARPEIARGVRTAQDLLAHRLIEVSTHRTGWYQVLGGRVGDGASSARFAFADNSVLALALAAAGHGIALARAPVTDTLIAGHGLMRCGKGIGARGSQAYYLTRPAQAAVRPAAAAFGDWLLRQARHPRPQHARTGLPSLAQSG